MADFVHYVRRRPAQLNYFPRSKDSVVRRQSADVGRLALLFHVTRQRGYP